MTQATAELAQKRAHLESILRGMGSVAVAFSGGVDSTLVLALARQVLGREGVLAVTAAGDVYVPTERKDAEELARRLDVRHVVIELDLLDARHFRENPPDRCYHCKRMVFGKLVQMANAAGIGAVCDGGNADDPGEHRPGIRAARELGVRSPLREAGLGKAEVRAISRELGLPTWDRPAMPCLATRFPYGRPVTREGLERVWAAEQVLAGRGYSPCRVRDHGDVARIEVAPAAIARLVAEREPVARALKSLGYAYVTVDLVGYRSGAMDEVLSATDRA